MKIIKAFLSMVAMATLIASCGSKSGSSLEVTVAYTNADQLPGRSGAEPIKVILQEVAYGSESPIMVDSATITNKDGEIVLEGSTGTEGIYELVVENGPVVLLINDASDIDVTIDLAKRDNYYTVSGSNASKELKTFIESYSSKTAPVNMAFKELDSLKQLMASDSVLLAATNRKNDAVKELNTFLESFISKSSNPAVSMFALGMSSRSVPASEFETLLQATVNKFPDYKTLAKLKENYDTQKAQSLALQKKNEEKGEDSWVGKPAPDLTMPSTTGKPISISSFKGKYVLVDFWASWCGPCRQENPAVLKAYEAYKNKNFTVLGVSLDKSKEAWLKAIQDDKLTWEHMSDLQYWDSKAVETYKFRGIPFNVLIDPTGMVIAEGLRGFDLEKKLAEVLK